MPNYNKLNDERLLGHCYKCNKIVQNLHLRPFLDVQNPTVGRSDMSINMPSASSRFS